MRHVQQTTVLSQDVCWLTHSPNIKHSSTQRHQVKRYTLPIENTDSICGFSISFVRLPSLGLTIAAQKSLPAQKTPSHLRWSFILYSHSAFTQLNCANRGRSLRLKPVRALDFFLKIIEDASIVESHAQAIQTFDSSECALLLQAATTVSFINIKHCIRM